MHHLPTPERAEAQPLTREALRDLMWRDVGIVRDRESLARARSTLAAWAAEAPAPADRESDELAGMLTCARLITEGALVREESRGAHCRSDFPQPREEWRRHLAFGRG